MVDVGQSLSWEACPLRQKYQKYNSWPKSAIVPPPIAERVLTLLQKKKKRRPYSCLRQSVSPPPSTIVLRKGMHFWTQTFLPGGPLLNWDTYPR